jgi:hypothetical protein
MHIQQIDSIEQLKLVYKHEFGRIIGQKKLASMPNIWADVHQGVDKRKSVELHKIIFDYQAKKGIVGLQLYSVRDDMNLDPLGSLTILATALIDTGSKMDEVINTMLAAEYIHPDESTQGWSPDSVDTQSIYKHLLTYYNPYSSGDEINFVSFKAFPKNIDPLSIRKSLAIELALEGYVEAIKYTLLEKNYNPNKSTFDAFLKY